jgi:two-component system invasion response regulator UvrY
VQDTGKRIQAAAPANHSMIAPRGGAMLSHSTEPILFPSGLKTAPPERESAPASPAPFTEHPLRVLLVDDHSIIRRGLKRIISSEFTNATFGEAGNADQALEAVLRQAWDLVLLDLTMPGRNGAEVLEQIVAIRPHLPVLVCSMHPEEQYAVPLLQAGAAGYIAKDTSEPELINAIKKVLTGEKHVSSALAENLVARLNHTAPTPAHESLSTREQEVMRLIAAGNSVKEIAYELDLSVKTISTYRSRLLKKLQLKTNGAVVRYALINNLVE